MRHLLFQSLFRLFSRRRSRGDATHDALPLLFAFSVVRSKGTSSTKRTQRGAFQQSLSLSLKSRARFVEGKSRRFFKRLFLNFLFRVLWLFGKGRRGGGGGGSVSVTRGKRQQRSIIIIIIIIIIHCCWRRFRAVQRLSTGLHRHLYLSRLGTYRRRRRI